MLKTEHFHLFIWKIFGKLLSLSPQKCIIYHKKQQVMKNKTIIDQNNVGKSQKLFARCCVL